ncbi:MAG: ribosome biogenesis GTPase YlqF, partial [Clostridia bacterium]|nr:ribosome biogenesis GTPase YlqF [Clostridia bacterium]
MQADTIQWFPGHMAKTRRLMAECLPMVDVVLELLDARIPQSSSNPEIKKLTDGKPLVKILNKASLADRTA